MKSKILRIIIVINITLLIMTFFELNSLYKDVKVFVEVQDLLLQEKGGEFVAEIVPLGVNIKQMSIDNRDVINIFPLRTFAPVIILLQTIFNLITFIYLDKNNKE